ncbi:MAG: M48 family metallopeptidase [Firmicutes bacterium]|nr:M48 family metallopeptidase [Bacillota bacterium]
MDYTLVRTSRKTIAIYIRPGGLVELRAPLHCPKRDIDRFVAAKAGWIEEKRALMLARRRIEPDPALEASLRARAKEILPEKVAYFAQRMGVSPAQVKITGAKTRWGSCSGRGNLNFSWRLMLADDGAIDYVVVHELAHLREMNHSSRFWAVVEAAMPDYRQRRLRLKRLQAALTGEAM